MKRIRPAVLFGVLSALLLATAAAFWLRPALLYSKILIHNQSSETLRVTARVGPRQWVFVLEPGALVK